MTEPRRGYTTTEFWGKTLLQLISFALAFYVAQNPGRLTPDQQNQVMVVAGVVVPPLMEVVYGVHRSWLKRAHVMGGAAATRRQA